MSLRKLIPILFAAPLAAWPADNPAVRGPVTGYIFDSQARAIRPMLGMPGAAYLDVPVVSIVDAASVAPDGSAALAVRGGRLMLYTGLANAAPSALNVPGGITGVDHFAWAPGAGSAAVYASTSAHAQVISNLSGGPSISEPLSLSTIAGKIAAFAFDGRQIIAGATASGAGGVYTVSTQGAVQRIASAASPSAIALAGPDLYFADQQTNQIWQVAAYATQPAAMLFASDASISTPVGLQISADATRLYAANAGSLKLSVYDIATRVPIHSVALLIAPTGLATFGDSSVYLLNGATATHQPIYVLSDRGGQNQAVYFVPNPGSVQPAHATRNRPLAAAH
jgi:hypothetical protein